MRARVLALSLTTALLAAVPASAAGPTKSQTFFRDALLEDAATASGVKRLLRTGGGFVDPAPTFADLTGDTRADAVVAVRAPGAAGTVAVYLFSTQATAGSGRSRELRAIFRSQLLYRATYLVRDSALVVRTPKFRQGDDVCCARTITERDYRWDAERKVVRRTDVREYDLTR